MAKSELKGTILIVNKPEVVGEKNTPKQTIIFKVPGYVDGFGDKVGIDEEWPLDVMGDNVAKLNLQKGDEGKKAQVVIFLNGAKFKRKLDDTDGWMINARLHQIKLFDGNTGQPQVSTAAGSNNDTW